MAGLDDNNVVALLALLMEEEEEEDEALRAIAVLEAAEIIAMEDGGVLGK